MKRVPTGGRVLELGCGNGLPVTAKLADRFAVTAMDVSPEQIERARRNAPGPCYVVGDMAEFSYPEASFDGVLARYSIIHVPRSRHASIFRSILSWLKPGGVFLATLGTSDSEMHVEEDWFGVPMYWSGFDADTYRALIRTVGFAVESDRVERTGGADGESEEEEHLWVVPAPPRRARPRGVPRVDTHEREAPPGDHGGVGGAGLRAQRSRSSPRRRNRLPGDTKNGGQPPFSSPIFRPLRPTSPSTEPGTSPSTK